MVSPQFFQIRVSDLRYRRVKHGIDPSQANIQAGRSTEELLRYDPDDPIRGEPYYTGDEDPSGPARGLQVMGGHHRLHELYTRYRRGEVDGAIQVDVQYEPWEYQ